MRPPSSFVVRVPGSGVQRMLLLEPLGVETKRRRPMIHDVETARLHGVSMVRARTATQATRMDPARHLFPISAPLLAGNSILRR